MTDNQGNYSMKKYLLMLGLAAATAFGSVSAQTDTPAQKARFWPG